jgi:hypothetical protein
VGFQPDNDVLDVLVGKHDATNAQVFGGAFTGSARTASACGRRRC